MTADLDALVGHQKGFRSAVNLLIGDLEPTPAMQRLVHADIYFGNTFLQGSRLWIFDFDNCEIAPAELDLATVFYDGVLCHFMNKVPSEQLTELVRRHWHAFIDGYRCVRDAPLDFAVLRKFIVLREAAIYVHYHRILDFSTLSDAVKAGFKRMRENVQLGRIEVDLDESWLA